VRDAVFFGERPNPQARFATQVGVDIPEPLEYDSFFFGEVLSGDMMEE
jgi:hypothetical protein